MLRVVLGDPMCSEFLGLYSRHNAWV